MKSGSKAVGEGGAGSECAPSAFLASTSPEAAAGCSAMAHSRLTLVSAQTVAPICHSFPIFGAKIERRPRGLCWLKKGK